MRISRMFARTTRIVPCLFCASFFCFFAVYLNVQHLWRFIPGTRDTADFVGLRWSIDCNFAPIKKPVESTKSDKNVWVYGNNMQSGYLQQVFKVFARLGFGNKSEVSPSWRLLCTHHYPFDDPKFNQVLKNMKSYQLVNHIPGSGFYISKVFLATSGLPGIPVAFRMPDFKEPFLEHAESHKGKLWVQKNDDKRETFVQEFVQNPLLIDGRKFDIGIYAMITSIEPLIVYVLNDEVLLRFCPKTYHPFDSRVLEKYVIGDEYTPVWKMPSLRRYYLDLGLNRKESLDAHLRFTSNDPAVIWNQIHDIIAKVFLDRKRFFIPQLKRYKHHLNFFELSRFDFVVDDQFRVHLMEGCKVCFACMTDRQKTVYRKAYLEHMNRHSMRRILPRPIRYWAQENGGKQVDEISQLKYEQDKLLALWCRSKCKQDSAWCN